MKKLLFTLFITFLCASDSQSQIVNTFIDGTPDDGIAIDSDGNIYCSNYVGDTVFKFTPSGNVSSFITGLNSPNGLAFDSNGDLYVCDGQGNSVYKYNANGNQIGSYPIAGHPSGIIKSFDSDDMIFTTSGSDRIYRLSTSEVITEISSDSGLNGPVGLAYDENGILYVGNYTDRDIYRVLANGDIDFVANVPTDGGQFPNLGFIAYGRGMLWGTTMGSDKIYTINPNAVQDVTLFAGSSQGSTDGDLTQATFHTTNGILFNDAEDTMYITDFGSKNLRIISDWNLGNDNFELSEDGFRLYPNPSDKVLQVSLSLNPATRFSLSIYNLMGQVLYISEKYLDRGLVSETIDIEFLDTGIYFLKVYSEGNEMTKRFVKR